MRRTLTPQEITRPTKNNLENKMGSKEVGEKGEDAREEEGIHLNIG